SSGGDSAAPAGARSRGPAVVAGAQAVEAERHRPQAVVWSGGSFGSPQELGASGTGYGFVSGAAQPAIDEAGEAVAVWLGSVGPAKQAVYAAALSAGGASFAPATLLSVSPECSPCVGVAMDPTGEAIAAWPAEGHMRVATRPAGGVFGLPAAV